jgi:hypothetical protein
MSKTIVTPWHAGATAMLAFALAGPAGAKPQYAAYEGTDSLQQGRGGTMVTHNGVDFWVTGAPPRRYQIIGVITDRKCLGLSLCGDPLKRPAVAQAARAGHGDAVILIGKSDDARGMVGSAASYPGPHYAAGFGWSSAVAEHGTTMLVVKYLDSAPRP